MQEKYIFQRFRRFTTRIFLLVAGGESILLILMLTLFIVGRKDERVAAGLILAGMNLVALLLFYPIIHNFSTVNALIEVNCQGINMPDLKISWNNVFFMRQTRGVLGEPILEVNYTVEGHRFKTEFDVDTDIITFIETAVPGRLDFN